MTLDSRRVVNLVPNTREGFVALAQVASRRVRVHGWYAMDENKNRVDAIFLLSLHPEPRGADDVVRAVKVPVKGFGSSKLGRELGLAHRLKRIE